MENNQNKNFTPNGPNRKQLAPRDMMIVALVILVITRLDFGNLNSFHILILFLLFLMLMLRWGNMRKEAVRKQSMDRYKAEYAAKEAAEKAAQEIARLKAEAAAEAAKNDEETPAVIVVPIETPAEESSVSEGAEENQEA